MVPVICVNNNKGGSLKTTTTVNLAGVLAEKKKKVLIIDCDNQGNIALSFGQNPDKYNLTIYDVLVGDCATEEAIVKVHKYIDIIPSNDNLVGFEFEVIRNRDKYINPFLLMKVACVDLQKKYDYIIIDTPPSLGLMVGNVFAFADGILIPFNPEQFSMRSLVKVTQTIQEFKEQYNNDLEILGVLGTLVDSRTSLHSDVLQSTRKYCLENNIRVFETVIPRTVRHASSIAYENVPATLSKKFKDAGQCYFELWKELEEIGTKETTC
ncbi:MULTISPECIES: ParA family protein [Bacillus]|uniref:Sporulation initiation inhibitor protein Soj n=3 Tax=Bacillus cereus group TaxID=86661 RepID=A0A9W5NZ03_BACCE|nr:MULTISPECIES: ParA family protein [Bacillus cereus group]EKS8367033.1 ParA family protein [Bacillus cereus]EEM44766.1 partition protein/ATPase [Bacillus thuringiensis serovar pakistani str. T13001]EJR59489.1 hypothetical protein IK5_06272 [Bacillus cereus VD154]EKS8373039.1 ParA family protein [Bacillus cereus]KIU72832.1 putative partition protein/ATPase [Bacillus thuringiensis Sbt003]